MRILHVYSGNLFGGIEAMLLVIARQPQDGAGLESEYALCFDGRLRRELVDAGARVHSLAEVRVSRPQTVRRARRALRALLASGRFDRVICHASWSHAIFGGLIRRTGIPLVVWAHDVLAGKHWTERWARRTPPDLAVCNSAFTAASVDAIHSGVPLVVVHPPVEAAAIHLSPVERAAVRAELDTSADASIVVQASRMESWKGHTVLLEALARLRHRDPWVCWLIGGGQRPHELAYLEALRARARDLRIADRVRFAGQRDDVPRLLAAADLHCQPNSSPEPFGVAFVEALAAGLPVVTSAIGGALEIVDASCGVLVPPSNPSALATALQQLLADAPLRARLAAAGPARARAVSDPAAQLDRLHVALAAMPAVPVRA
jgi:glycosyltransferase involved in cell wall biosynthesis